MIRICDAVNRHSKIKAVGLCHQIYAGYTMVGVALAKDLGIEVPEGLTGMHAAVDQSAAQYRMRQQIVPLIDIRAAGLNHFTWIFRFMTNVQARTFIRYLENASLNWTRPLSR